MTVTAAPHGELRRAEKACRRCGKELPLDAFALRNGKPHSWCRSCHRSYHREKSQAWYRENKERHNENSRRWAEQNRDRQRELHRNAYWRNPDAARASKKAWYEKNKEHVAEYDRARYSRERARVQRAEWRAANPEKAREANRRWRQQNPDSAHAADARKRAMRAAAPVAERVNRSYIIERDGSRCHICGKSVRPEDIHLDHLIPLSRGGEESTRNVRVAHSTCNLRRGPGRIPAQLLLVG